LYKKRPPGLLPAFPLSQPFLSLSPGYQAMTETLQCLKKYGQRLDLEIAKEMRMPLATVRQHLKALADSRQAIVCRTIQFHNGRQVEAWQGRVSGFVPPYAPGRKPKAKE
jgi:hypothetical protein